jgi:hypothetical protein
MVPPIVILQDCMSSAFSDEVACHGSACGDELQVNNDSSACDFDGGYTIDRHVHPAHGACMLITRRTALQSSRL